MSTPYNPDWDNEEEQFNEYGICEGCEQMSCLNEYNACELCHEVEDNVGVVA